MKSLIVIALLILAYWLVYASIGIYDKLSRIHRLNKF
jgi:hypothetical protein